MQQKKNSKTDITNINNESIANVLIADSDPEITRFLLEILARKGIRGHIVDNKESMRDFINKGNCDLIFASDKIIRRTDLTNKHQNYYELIEKIKAGCPELPVCVLPECFPLRESDFPPPPTWPC